VEVAADPLEFALHVVSLIQPLALMEVAAFVPLEFDLPVAPFIQLLTLVNVAAVIHWDLLCTLYLLFNCSHLWRWHPLPSRIPKLKSMGQHRSSRECG
jgi:hypothetical protein